jgi:hypothetical protein
MERRRFMKRTKQMFLKLIVVIMSQAVSAPGDNTPWRGDAV